MTAQDFDDQAKRLLLQVLGMEPEQREGFLDEACAGRPELRAEVDSLLLHGENQPSGLMGEVWTDDEQSSTTASGIPECADSHPDRIGNYHILQKIGEGGMGIVYLAEQEKPIRRRVALKLIKWGMDTKAVVARFEAERQALALMNHPNVAKVFDAGATEQGRPYFVMEYVKGVPIAEHCDRHRLTTTERLELFIQVCDGVQHAHQKGIIHRDIKPSNILVAIDGDKSVPTIIDFGVAKATDHRLTEQTVFTEFGRMIGTPEYMSPEQAEMTNQDIDTRTDVYSLGVVLYELLVGALPFDSRELRQAALAEIQRTIREDEPSKPSTKLGTLGDEATAAAHNRQSDPRTLTRRLRGDLDWITMKALEKDRSRRYGSPLELASDLARSLRHEPVTAGPPSVGYRLTKFARRHRTGVSLATVGLLVLVVFAVAMSVQTWRIARERDRANQAAKTSEQISNFLTDMLSDINPRRLGASLQTDLRNRVAQRERNRGSPKERIVAAEESFETAVQDLDFTGAALRLIDEEILSPAAYTIKSKVTSDPLIAAQLSRAVSETYLALGLREQAEPHAEAALDLRRDLLGDEHPETFEAMIGLATTYYARARYDDALPLVREALNGRRRVLGNDHPDTLRTMANLAEACFFTTPACLDEAERVAADGLEVSRRIFGNDDNLTIRLLRTLGRVYWTQENLEAAEPILLEVYETRVRLVGEESGDAQNSMMDLTIIYWEMDRYKEAEEWCLRRIEIASRLSGEDSVPTLWAESNLASIYWNQGRFEEAERLHQKSVAGLRSVQGEHGIHLVWALFNFGCEAAESGHREKAFDNLRQATAAGWSAHNADDSCLDSLRGDPEFEGIVAAAKERVAGG